MAKIQEEIVVIKLSKLVKDDSQGEDKIATDELVESLAAVASEIAGVGIIVEIEQVQ